jgi:hypothetical protein
MGICKYYAGSGNTVDVGRLYLRSGINTAEIAITQIIGKDKNDIRQFLSGLNPVTSGEKYKTGGSKEIRFKFHFLDYDMFYISIIDDRLSLSKFKVFLYS